MASFLKQVVRLHGVPFRAFFAFLLVGISWSCAKIATFDEPYMSEVFMGNCTLTPSVKGISSAGFMVCTVGLSGDASGKKVTIHGIPNNEPFTLLPEKLYSLVQDNPTDFPPTISGFTADVVDKKTLRVTGFASQSDSAKALNMKATGTIYREGPQIASSAKDPIVISVQVGPLKDKIPDIFLQYIKRTEDNKPITELDDDDMVPLYRLDFRPEIVTVF